MSRLTVLVLTAVATAGIFGSAVVSAQTPTQPAPTATATVPTQTPTQVPPTPTRTPTPAPPTSTAAIAAAQAPAADSYVVTGTGFGAGEMVWVTEVPCGVLPCAAGPGPATKQVQASGAGSFSTLIQLPTGQNLGKGHRLIAAYGTTWTQAQIDAAPTVKVPEYHPGFTPSAPATGAGLAAHDGGTNWAPAVGAAVAGLLALLAFESGRRRYGQSATRR